MLSGHNSWTAPAIGVGWQSHLGFWVALALGVGGTASELRAQSQSTIHWTNNAGQGAVSVLNSSSTFVTSFKLTNDLSIKMLSGTVMTNEVLAFSGSSPRYNPWYLLNFTGYPTNGTGNGAQGAILMLKTSPDSSIACSIQFDFTSPLTPRDHILVTDVDSGEAYSFAAYTRNGANYTQVSLTNWTYENYSGQMNQVPGSDWPIWDSTNGTLTATVTLNNTEPLSVLTPGQSIDRLVFTRLATGGINAFAHFQILAEPKPTGKTTLTITPAGDKTIVSWPQASSNLTLYSSTTLQNDWLPVTNHPPALLSGSWVVTNTTADTMRFYRLQWP
jgi:hypothetical protein